ncbi:MAG: chromosomal replication initiator protein DnaA [Desulfobacteraceae bacterium]|nr:chromosomal replication initiator protein DnaA [Desulfobacteraceae bacterium]MDH3722872.1 chromosomal replication initiator protein DnaA [Desulfobacteraceae bacterium]
MKKIWDEAKVSIKAGIPAHTFRMWIEPLQLARCDENRIVLYSPNFFSRKRVLEIYGSLIESEIKSVLGKECQLSIEISAKNALPKPKAYEDPQLLLPNINVCPRNGRLLKKDFTFDHFVVGENNDFAYSASLSMASRKNASQNCLFLLSKTGLGKSHLTQAVGHHILSENPSDRVYYMTAEDFSNEMVDAFQHGSINSFKEKYRNQCDVLLLEDVHYLRNKDRTQVELAFALDTLFEAGKKIIFSSCYLPGDIPKIDDKLRSRLSCGLISNINPPDFRTRVRILQKKAKFKGYDVPEEVIQYLASELTEDVRQLESGLIGVASKSLLLGEPIDLELAQSVTKHIVHQRKNVTIDAIKKLVCKHYRISIKDIVSSSRKQPIVRPRQIAIYLSRKYTDAPLQVIGKSFNRYHATALHSIGIVERGIKKNSPLQKQVEFLCKKLESGKF